MPSIQLTKKITQIALVTATFLPGNGLSPVTANVSVQRGVSPAFTNQFVPTNEYWYITGYFLSASQTTSIANALLRTWVNNTIQPMAPSEDEIHQTTQNKLSFPPEEWVQLPNGQSWFQDLLPLVAIVTTTTTVTIQETLLRVPLSMMA